MLDPAIGTLLAGALALLFASAAIHKLRSLERFAEVFRAYALLPRAAERLARLVPALELSVALGLLTGAARTGASAAGAALLLLYAGAIAINLLRGRRDLDCGCEMINERRPIALWMVWRNVFLAGLLGVLLLPWIARPMHAVDALTIGAGIAVAALLYMSVDQLLGRTAPRTRLMQGAGTPRGAP